MLFTRNKREMPRPEEALPGREERMPVPSRHEVNGNRLAPPFPEGWSSRSSAWAASGAPSGSSGRPGGSTRPPSVTRAARRRTPPTRKSAAGLHGPRRGGARGLRPEAHELLGDVEDLLGESRPDAGDAPGQRCRDAIPLRDLLRPRRHSARPLRRRARSISSDCRRRLRRRSRPRFATRRSSTMQRSITSSTSRRTQGLLRDRRHRRGMPDRARPRRVVTGTKPSHIRAGPIATVGPRGGLKPRGGADG